MKSSYIENNFSNVIKTICFLIKPKVIVEFGILDGYSLKSFIESTDKNCEITAYDLFDEFPYNSANFEKIKNEYGNLANIKKSDFYKSENLILDDSVDIMHIDIANDANVFKFAIEKYLKKIKKNGILILEGGSKERDEVYWMNKFNKPKINPYLDTLKEIYDIKIIEDYPSMTIIKK